MRSEMDNVNGEAAVGSPGAGVSPVSLRAPRSALAADPVSLRTPRSALPAPSAPPQFSLRSLLLWIAGLSVLFAVMAAVGARWSVLVAWFALLAAAHVAANSWGSRVGRRRGHFGPSDDPSDHPLRAVTPRPTFAPTSRLRERVGLGRGMWIATSLGAALGAAAGGFLLWPARVSPMIVVGYFIGVLSAAAIGAFLGFLGSSFLDVALKAWAEAAAEPARPTPLAPIDPHGN
jgi:hypothetical protein